MEKNKNSKEAEHFKKNYNFKNSIEDDDDDESYSKQNKGKSQVSNSKTPILDSFSRDLTKMAQDGKLDPIVGRGKEIERVSQILSRRKKNNPILIGEPGCVDGDTLITIRKISDEMGHEIINI
jgi:ATP-dependent Clp protease ATP-binding subunit ClpC